MTLYDVLKDVFLLDNKQMELLLERPRYNINSNIYNLIDSYGSLEEFAKIKIEDGALVKFDGYSKKYLPSKGLPKKLIVEEDVGDYIYLCTYNYKGNTQHLAMNLEYIFYNAGWFSPESFFEDLDFGYYLMKNNAYRHFVYTPIYNIRDKHLIDRNHIQAYGKVINKKVFNEYLKDVIQQPFRKSKDGKKVEFVHAFVVFNEKLIDINDDYCIYHSKYSYPAIVWLHKTEDGKMLYDYLYTNKEEIESYQGYPTVESLDFEDIIEDIELFRKRQVNRISGLNNQVFDIPEELHSLFVLDRL